MRRWGMIGWLLLLAVLAPARRASASETLQWSGFAFARASSAPSSGPLETQRLSSQLHLGIDWLPAPRFAAHLHLVARNATPLTRRGSVGIAEAYLEGNFRPRGDRLRLRGGALFLPTSRENVDALWETPYTMTPSALNSWLGEEFRPIGLDATWFHRRWMAGATLFRGNDTFGALPAVRGWRLRDHWALLGEWQRVDDEYYTSVSAETDHSIGWSARAGWSGEHVVLQLTHIDNRSDALDHGLLFNWNTRFEIVAAEYTGGDWTVAAESGWGPTVIIVEGVAYPSDLQASYLLVSRHFARARVSLRGELFDNRDSHHRAITAAFFYTPRGRVRTGIELTSSDGDHRLSAEIRYHFSGM